MTSFLPTSDLDASALRENFIAYLQSQDQFKDYNFQGSNISVLIDILIQNTMYNNFYQNMVGAESFLDSAELRESIVSRAKELNYVPKSKSASRAVISLELFPQDSPNAILLSKGYRFKASVSNITYYFSTRQNYTITKENNRYLLENIEIFEGESVTEYFTLNSTTNNGITTYTNSCILQSENADISSLEVYVTLNGVRTKFTKATELYGLTGDSKVYFIEGYKANQYRIVFGDGIIGMGVPSGSLVEVNYSDVVGEETNGVSIFEATSAIDGYSGASIITTTSAYGGGPAESNENIKFNAPRHFQTQERAVIADDYKNLILNNFPEIQAVSAYGGEEDFKFGKVIVCLKPWNSTILSQNLSNRIYTFLRSKNLTTEPIIKNLEYFYIQLNSVIRYNSELTSDSQSDIKSSVIENIIALNDTKFNKFNQSVYSSYVSGIINDSHDAIISNSTELKIIKRLTPEVNKEISHEIDFDNELVYYGYNYENADFEPVVKSSTFTYDYNGSDYTCWIQDDGIGNLGLYTNNNQGTKVRISYIGTVDYTEGLCVFALKIKGYDNYISLTADTKSRDILVRKNKFILFDGADFNISMVMANA